MPDPERGETDSRGGGQRDADAADPPDADGAGVCVGGWGGGRLLRVKPVAVQDVGEVDLGVDWREGVEEEEEGTCG